MARLYTQTSESQEYRLAQTLIWSTTDFSLAEFVKQFELPQVVFVEVGYDGGDERTTFSSGQILTLHTVRTVSKIVCQVPPNNAVLVPKDCPLKAEVIPMSCHDTVVTAYKLSTIYRKVKYVRVMEIGSTPCVNNSLDSTRIDDILQIKKVSTSESVIRCKNLTTEQDVSILIDSTAVFVPLVDSNTYTLAEIQKKFGLPAKVRFLDKDAERKLHSAPKARRQSKTSPYLSDMGQIKAVEEMQDSDVIVTTVCSNLEEKVCLPVPTTLDIRVTVAEGFLKGDETYQKVVKTLDKQFKRTDLKDFADLDVYQHMDAVKKEMQDIISVNSTIEEASNEIKERARESAQRISQKKRILSFNTADKPPKIVPRGIKSPEEKKPPPIPPKPGQKPESKSKKTDKIMRGIKLTKSKNFLGSLERKHSSSKSTSSEETYEQAIEQGDGIYSCAYETFYERSDDDISNSSSEYQELDVSYEAVPRSYEKLLHAPNTQIKKINRSTIQSLPLPPTPSETIIPPPPLPTTSPPQTEDRNAIYEAISRYPQDLSGLTVADVSKLLRYLGMKDYVETFENELIDGEMLITLDQNSLQSLSVQSFHCNKLLRFIGGWRPNV